jgi:iron(III) transport system substrate-binding protein
MHFKVTETASVGGRGESQIGLGMSRLRTLRSKLLGAALAAAVLIVGCGSTGGNGSSGGDTSAQDLQQMPLGQLYKLAKKEGTFTMYGDGNVMPTLYKSFAAKYPGIKMNLVDEQDSALAVRAEAEAAAGKVVGDVWASPTESLDALVQGGLIDKFGPPEAAAFPAHDKTAYWVGNEVQPEALCWNTKKVAAADAPTTWADLSNPKYKKYSIGIDPDAWIIMLAYAQDKFGGDKSKAENVFKAIAKTDHLVPGTGGRALVNSLASGDIDINMSCEAHIYAQLKSQGAPLAISKTESVPEPVGIAILKDDPHPAAAMLVARWLLSDDGQRALAADDRIPANKKIPAKIDVATTHEYTVLPAVVSSNDKDYAADWKQIFGLH